MTLPNKFVRDVGRIDALVRYLLLVTALVGCREVPRSTVTIVDSAGIQLMLNDSVDQLLRWEYVPVTRYGGDAAGPGAFYELEPNRVAVAQSGTVYVLDAAARHIVRIDADGSLEVFAGAHGEGPGEFTRPVSLAIAPNDDVVALDAGRGLYIRFAPDGTLKGEWEASSYDSFTPLEGSNVLGTSQQYTADGYYHFLRYEPGQEVARTPLTQTTRYRLTSCGGGFNILAPVIFAPQVVWAASPSKLAVNADAVYSIDVLAGNSLVRRIRRGTGRRVATVAAAEAWARANPTRVRSADGECIYRASEVVEKRQFAEAIPAMTELRWNGTQELWIARWTEEFTVQRIDVFDSIGVYLGTLPAGLPFPVGFLPTGEALYVERDAMDIERLVVAEVISADQVVSEEAN